MNVRKKILKVLAKLLESLKRREKSGFVEVEKNLLLSHYIDIFHGIDNKLNEKEIKNYRKDLASTLKNISTYFE